MSAACRRYFGGKVCSFAHSTFNARTLTTKRAFIMSRKACTPTPGAFARSAWTPRALESGAVRILELSLVFPDGEIYQAPDADTLPDPLRLEELPAGVSGTVIHLALPLLQGAWRQLR